MSLVHSDIARTPTLLVRGVIVATVTILPLGLLALLDAALPV